MAQITMMIGAMTEKGILNIAANKGTQVSTTINPAMLPRYMLAMRPQTKSFFHRRRRHVLERGELLLHVIEPLDVQARRRSAEQLVFDVLELQLDRVEHREVAVHHRVHQRVEHVPGAVAQ